MKKEFRVQGSAFGVRRSASALAGSRRSLSSFIFHPSSFPPAFTLVEVALAVAVVAVGLVGILALFPLGLRATRTANDDTEMATIGQEFVARYQQMALTSANYSDPYVLPNSFTTTNIFMDRGVTYTVQILVTNDGFPQMTNASSRLLLSRVAIQVFRPGSKTNTYLTEVARYVKP